MAFWALVIALAIIAILVVPAGTISVSANKSGGAREVIPSSVEAEKPQR